MRVAEGGWRWVFGCFFADAINKARIAERVELLRRFHMWLRHGPCVVRRDFLASSLCFLRHHLTT
jgi:hypothetical protein